MRSGTVHVRGAAMANIDNIVLVHGGFVDGSGWSSVYDILKKERSDLFARTAARFYRLNAIG
jgi:hypothetical protein